MKTAIGLDLYNQVTTGQKTMTLCGARMDPHHMPCVLVSAPNIQRRAEASDTRERERERESGCLRHRQSSDQLRRECQVRLSHHGRGEHSAESKRTECRGRSDYETNQRKVGALCAVDYKQVQSQMVEAGKLILVPVTQ